MYCGTFGCTAWPRFFKGRSISTAYLTLPAEWNVRSARVGSRAAFDLARLLLRGVEYGWPSPLPAAAADPSERAAELLAVAAADGHVRAQEMLDAAARTMLAARPEAHAQSHAQSHARAHAQSNAHAELQLVRQGDGEAGSANGNKCHAGPVRGHQGGELDPTDCRQLQEHTVPQSSQREATFEDVVLVFLLAITALIVAAIAVRRRMAKGGGGVPALGARILLRAKRAESVSESCAIM
jgi:hypothetical protein